MESSSLDKMEGIPMEPTGSRNPCSRFESSSSRATLDMEELSGDLKVD